MIEPIPVNDLPIGRCTHRKCNLARGIRASKAGKGQSIMKLRQHRGGYSESMATTIEIEPTRPALLQAILASDMIGMPDPLTEDMIGVTSGMGRDPRNGWDTHIVTIKDWGVYGYTDGPVP